MNPEYPSARERDTRLFMIGGAIDRMRECALTQLSDDRLRLLSEVLADLLDVDGFTGAETAEVIRVLPKSRVEDGIGMVNLWLWQCMAGLTDGDVDSYMKGSLMACAILTQTIDGISRSDLVAPHPVERSPLELFDEPGLAAA